MKDSDGGFWRVMHTYIRCENSGTKNIKELPMCASCLFRCCIECNIEHHFKEYASRNGLFLVKMVCGHWARGEVGFDCFSG